MVELPPWAIAISGLFIGAVLGYAVRRARLCSFGAIEDALIGKDWRRMKVFGLALAVALLGTQAIVLAGGFDPAVSTYIPSRVAFLSAAIGAVMFGVGMAFVGTCAFGSLVRLGGGDLRSLITMLIFGAVAFGTIRGVVADLRIDYLEAIAVPMPGSVASSFADLGGFFTDPGFRLPLALLCFALLAGLALFDRRLRKSPRLLVAGLLLGLGTIAGWYVTAVAVDPFGAEVRPQSLTFVAPVARTLFALIASLGQWFEFGVMCVFGVVAGAFVHARQKDEFRWEAFDDHYEMRRHMIGGVLMGFGGVLAGGCTIGQGITAGSLLAVTWPVTVGGMILGARLGIAIVMEGSLIELVRSRLPQSTASKTPAE